MRRALRFSARFFLAASALVLALWLIGRLATDRWVWSQYLFWLPEEVELAVAGLLAVLGWVLAPLGQLKRRRGRWWLAVGLAMAAMHLLLAHWRVTNLLARPGRGASAQSLRIANWNVTAIEDGNDIIRSVFPLNPDIAILVNPHARPDWQGVIGAFGKPAALIWEGNMLVLSHVPIIRHGSVQLGIPPPVEGASKRRWPDPGRAMFVELDTTERLGRTTVLWIIDMPSDWRLARWAEASRAAAAIGAWPGPQIAHDATGRTAPEPGGPGFPTPDIVMGDFNAPRGSASLSLLAPGMVNAFDQGGAGYTASWPGWGYRVPFPVIHIDQAFVAPWLRAARYEILTPTFGYHWPQWVEVVRK